MGSSFAALRSSQFKLIWIGLAATGIAGAVQQFALGWLLVQVAVNEGQPERAPLYIGLVGVSRGVPGLVFGLLGGVFADRMDRRRVLLLSRTSGAVFALLLAALVITGQAGIGVVMVLNGLGAVADSMELPLRQSLVSNILEPRDLVGAQGVMNSTFNVTQIAGPLAAGLLIGPVGIGGLFVVTGAASLVAVGALRGLLPVAAAHVTDTGVLRSLREGLFYVMREPVLRWAIILSAVASTFVRPLPTMLPAIAENTLHVGATGLSLLLAMTSAGGLVGALLSVLLGGRGRQGRSMVLLVVAWGLLNVLFAVQRDFIPALLLAALPLICWSSFASLSQLLCQAITPDRLRGRTLSLYAVTLSAFMPLGALVVGSLGTLLGVEAALIIGGLVTSALGACVLITSAAVRRADIMDGVRR